MLSEATVQAEYVVAADELAGRLCDPIGHYVNIEARHPVADSQILNKLVAQNEGQPYDCGYLQIDLNMDIVHSALEKAHRFGMIKALKEGDDVTACPIDCDFGVVLLTLY